MYKNILVDAGLSDKQATLYALLLKNGELSAQEIITKTNLRRATVYDVLKSLSHKGLVVKFQKRKKSYFRSEHPYNLREIALKRRDAVELGVTQLENTMNDLVSVFMTSTHMPGVLVYEGREGVKKVYEDLISEGEEILSIVQPSDVDPQLYKWLTTSFIRKRVSHKIVAKVIVAGMSPEAETYLSNDKNELRTSRSIIDSSFKVGIELMIYKDKVAYVSFNKDADLMGIIIQNSFIANTMRSIWNILWKNGNEK